MKMKNKNKKKRRWEKCIILYFSSLTNKHLLTVCYVAGIGSAVIKLQDLCLVRYQIVD